MALWIGSKLRLPSNAPVWIHNVRIHEIADNRKKGQQSEQRNAPGPIGKFEFPEIFSGFRHRLVSFLRILAQGLQHDSVELAVSARRSRLFRANCFGFMLRRRGFEGSSASQHLVADHAPAPDIAL